ncbi:hypothetical protein [Streptosporangium carneum]|uniref:Fatty acid desaturase domain-containing protein n=1 Tax=Streptosporangium carneum TaxID=47481 RepID=A0A9W6I861_9ACTN|nr:hypothetical protein [Streptosporangium carneum]GLK12740.1 hypothetical protein GCM10017600_61500 [Streptosporangium carneum]
MVHGTRSPDVIESTMQDLRLEYAQRFPGWTQQLITIFSGKAVPGQQAPWWIPPPIVNWFLTLFQLVLAVLGSVFAVRFLSWWALFVLPVTWLVTVNAVRKLQVTWSHHAVHKEVSGNKYVDKAVQLVSSAVSLTSNYEDIFNDHIRNHHNRKVFTTGKDPDSAFLVYLGFRPGMPVSRLRARLYWTPFSPRLHIPFVIARIKTNFITATWSRRIASVVWVGLLVLLGVLMDGTEYTLAFLVPWLPLFHWAALFQTISEHPWMAFDGAPTSRNDYIRRCWARFCLEPLPERGTSLALQLPQWGHWLVRMLFLQVPARFAVLVSDLPAHDLHHVVPADHAWHYAFWHRQACIDSHHESRMEQRELTLGVAISYVLSGISLSPLAAAEPQSHTAT